jgi:hypothetical protein
MTKRVEEGQKWHCNDIPHGYVPVEVEQVVTSWEDLELDIPGGDGETKLGQCSHCIILWSKADIVIPDTPAATNKPPSPPRDPQDHDDSPGAPDASPSPPPKRSPSPPPKRSPSPPPKRGRRTKASAPTPPAKKARKTREKPAPEKRAGEKTLEELEASVKADTKRQMAEWRRKPEPEPKLDPTIVKSFLGNLSKGQQKEVIVTDYDRSLLKSRRKRKAADKEAGPSKKVPQLGQQPQRPLGPLPSLDELNIQRVMAETGLTRAQVLGEEEVPVNTTLKWPFKLGEPMVPPEMESNLQTKMRRFHDWYLEESRRNKRRMIKVGVKDQDFYNGDADFVWLRFNDIYELYHRDAMDVDLITCWTL